MKNYTTQKFILYSMLMTMLIYSCIPEDDSYSEFPDTPTNLIDFNTEFDDYNSTAPSYGETFPFCFSSNRNSSGHQYDIVYKLMTIDFSKDSRELKIFNNTNGNLSVVIENSSIANALDKINTTSNEFGPYLIPNGRVQGGSNINNRYESYILMYSSEHEGNHNIMFTDNIEHETFSTPEKIDFVNSEYDDLYPVFNKDYSKLFFSSNRDGNYDIFSNKTDYSKGIIEILKDSKSEVIKEDVLSSEFDDICPFIIDSLLVFASNREGGYGGYDLYYSKWKDEQWTAPVNFGDKINSQFDEYRPIVRIQWEFNNDIMIFSSNRSGGKGGFDLYFVGIDQLR